MRACADRISGASVADTGEEAGRGSGQAMGGTASGEVAAVGEVDKAVVVSASLLRPSMAGSLRRRGPGAAAGRPGNGGGMRGGE